ncbi:MAG: hypothetical protein CVU79_01715 [Elusimicrobia bacterium HGW-Elusimicrobia-3]|nr:MAG: hypothetical protein CVU79_01715 [Elusimicrobia bacterium HGW-Elusimicrobia-3]
MQSEFSADAMRDVYNFIKGNWEYQLLFGAMGAALLIGLIYIFLEWRRVKAIAAMGEGGGLEYHKHPGLGFSLRAAAPALLSLGDYNSVSHGLRDAAVLPGAWYLDFEYTVRGGKSNHRYNFGLALYRDERLAVPEFELSPETLLDRAGDLVTKRDIDFPERPGFSGRYALTGPDKERVAALFTPEITRVFEGLRGGWQVQGAGKFLLVFKRGLVPAAAYPAFIEEARAVFRAFLADPRNTAASPAPAPAAEADEGEVAQAQLYRMIGGGAGLGRPAEMILAVAFVGFMIAVLYALLMS